MKTYYENNFSYLMYVDYECKANKAYHVVLDMHHYFLTSISKMSNSLVVSISEKEAIEYVYVLLKDDSNKDELRNIIERQLYKMGGINGIGSYWIWKTYTSKDLIERVKTELSFIQLLNS